MLSALRQACSATISSAAALLYVFDTRTSWPRSRRMCAQRNAVVPFPDRDDERAGVIMTMRMNENLICRPTSGASVGELAHQLRDTRALSLLLTEDLSPRQLMGPMLPIVNPILWEI